MSDGANNRSLTDSAELWKQWYEASSKMWLNLLDGNKGMYADPYSLYSSWLKSMADAQKQLSSLELMDFREFWKSWFDATTEAWKNVASMDSSGFATQWLEMVEDARARLLAGENIPADPFTFFKQWYEATSETWAKVVGDVIGSEKFMENASHFLESYSSFTRTFSHASEEYFRSLQLPTRSDIARVAELVVNLEEKVDQIEDTFGDFEEGYSKVATSDSIQGLEGRLERVESELSVLPGVVEKIEAVQGLTERLNQVESKLDKVLATLEKLEVKESAKPATSTDGSSRKGQKRNTSDQEVESSES
jgi:polyhydroxyalkanoic acid synthase PhaR subunit